MSPENNTGSSPLPEIRRAPLGQLTSYEISESELEALEKGSQDSIYLNFAIFLLSIAISFTVTLIVSPISSLFIFMAFMNLSVIGYLGGVFLLLLWYKNQKSAIKVADNIRKRLPSQDENVAPESED